MKLWQRERNEERREGGREGGRKAGREARIEIGGRGGRKGSYYPHVHEVVVYQREKRNSIYLISSCDGHILHVHYLK